MLLIIILSLLDYLVGYLFFHNGTMPLNPINQPTIIH